MSHRRRHLIAMGGLLACAATLLFGFSQAFARTASCPCPNPCPCSPCTCGGGKSQPSGGSKSQPTPAKTTSTSDQTKTTSKHHEGTTEKSHHHGGGCGHGHHHGGCGGGGVGISVFIPDGLGARKQEGDPFATTPQQPTAHTQEKPERPKTRDRDVVRSSTFDDVRLTGEEAKGDVKPPETNNVSDETESPPPVTEVGPGKAPFTVTDLKNMFQFARTHFGDILGPQIDLIEPDLTRLFYQMKIALGDLPRDYLDWLMAHPDQVGKILKAASAAFIAEKNYYDAFHNFADAHKDKYGDPGEWDAENWDLAVREDFDPTPDGQRLGDAWGDAAHALQDALGESRGDQDPEWGSKWAAGNYQSAQDDYKQALDEFFGDNEEHQQLKAAHEAATDISDIAHAKIALDHNEEDLENKFQKTPKGKKLAGQIKTAKNMSDKAANNLKEAQKKASMPVVKE